MLILFQTSISLLQREIQTFTFLLLLCNDLYAGKCIDRWLFQEKDSVGKSPASLVPTGSEKWLEEVRYAAQFGPETIQYYRVILVGLYV